MEICTPNGQLLICSLAWWGGIQHLSLTGGGYQSSKQPISADRISEYIRATTVFATGRSAEFCTIILVPVRKKQCCWVAKTQVKRPFVFNKQKLQNFLKCLFCIFHCMLCYRGRGRQRQRQRQNTGSASQHCSNTGANSRFQNQWGQILGAWRSTLCMIYFWSMAWGLCVQWIHSDVCV